MPDILPRPTQAQTALALHLPWLVVAAGLVALYAPTLAGLFRTVWSTDEQGHGPIVLAVVGWLLWRQRALLVAPAPGGQATTRATGTWVLLALGLLLYVFGRSQRILSAQTLSAVLVLTSTLWLLRGRGTVQAMWFPLFFMLFLVPLPAVLVDALTQPIKLGVSSVATELLYWLGYPVARSGVILQVGQYQMLVADACAGLHTLFTLEAMGLLYLNLVRTASWGRNVGLALLIVPISFVANVIRVIVLCLITYHYGDAAGQGFLHGFAGMVLFISALLLIVATDSVLRWSGLHAPRGGSPA